MSTFRTDDRNNLAINGARFELLSGTPATLQTAKSFANTLRGEMMHDIQSGVRYFETAFDATRLQLLRDDLIERIKQAPGVESVVDMQIEKVTDGIRYSATIKTEQGNLIINEII